MKIFQLLNVADLAFIAAGIAAAVVMSVVGARDGREEQEVTPGQVRRHRSN